MRSIHFGQSIPTSLVITLSFVVTVNIYNLILASINHDDHANRILLGKDLKLKKVLILLQTILSILAILLYKKYTSLVVNLIKFWILGPLIVTLFFDMILTTTTAVYLLRDRHLDEFWKILHSNDHGGPMYAPDILYYFVSTIIFFYFVFKLYTTIVAFSYTGTFVKGIGVSSDSNPANNDDIERNAPRSPSPPPQYDQCVLESAMPPPYSEVQNQK